MYQIQNQNSYYKPNTHKKDPKPNSNKQKNTYHIDNTNKLYNNYSITEKENYEPFSNSNQTYSENLNQKTKGSKNNKMNNNGFKSRTNQTKYQLRKHKTLQFSTSPLVKKPLSDSSPRSSSFDITDSQDEKEQSLLTARAIQKWETAELIFQDTFYSENEEISFDKNDFINVIFFINLMTNLVL